MKKMFTQSSFLRFTRRERKSVLFLVAVLGLIVTLYTLSFYLPYKQPYALTISSYDNLITPESESGNNQMAIKKPNPEFELFDPNKVSESQLLTFGVSRNGATNWVKYINKGGRFESSEDLKKIYGLSPNVYEKLIPFIRFEQKAVRHSITEHKNQQLDPNTASFANLISIGLPPFAASSFIKYRNSGAVFYAIEDLKKIRALNDSLLHQISSQLVFPSKPASLKSNSETSIETSILYDLNAADTAQLKYLPGIGSKLAFRIVKYRDHLGGFYSLHQLGEIYGLSDSTLNKIKDFLVLGSSIKTIKVNTVDFTRIYHPYINKKQAFLIQNYIDEHKPIQGVEDLQKMLALDTAFWKKLAPYFDFSTE